MEHFEANEEEYWATCDNCEHEICKHCRAGCHNICCEEMARPIKTCYDNLLKK